MQLDLLLHFPADIPVDNVEYMLQAAALLIFANDESSALMSKFNMRHVKKSKQRTKRSSGAKSDNNDSKFEEDASLNISRQKRRRTNHLRSQQQHRHRQHR